ncbi:MAG: 16S rRNA (cytosine(967)-C(5))-methyltransferase RsmB [Clostridia bacterium]|nr:16S rRNA (cytosine(967)-C(5))-methyltransferase RsmB [Clostridia bacterium]
MENVRAVALSVLNKCAAAEQYSNLALDTALKRNHLSAADRGLLTTMVYGVIEKQLTLDHWITQLANRPTEEMDLSTQNLLRLGLYQMAFLDRVPDHAAVHETVSLAPKRTRGFVNAVLRAFGRSGKSLPMPDANTEPIAYLSVKYSFSPAICRVFVERFGFGRTEELLEAFNRQPPINLRVNTLKRSRKELLQILTEAGYHATPTVESHTGVQLSAAPVAELPGFAAGEFFVQDEASQLCVEALDAQPGLTVLDVCACPGSKSFGAAIDMNDQGRVISCDLHANKLSLVQSGAERLGISILQTVARDAREPDPAWDRLADRVLCDVPCSGFGVFAKKPELRYKDPQKSAGLPDIQLAILQNASAFVKTGGLLVYSTCTILPEENEGNVARFLRSHGEFELLRQRTLYPDTDGTDGFFFAVLKRN